MLCVCVPPAPVGDALLGTVVWLRVVALRLGAGCKKPHVMSAVY